MRIGVLSERTGVSVRSLRYYERCGLIHAERDHSGYRHFDESAVGQVAHIQLLFSAGLCSSKIRDLLAMVDGDEKQIILSRDAVADLESAGERLRRQLDDLSSALALLDGLLDASRTGTPRALLDSGPRSRVRGAVQDRVVFPNVDRFPS